jgi:hypothetical protein
MSKKQTTAPGPWVVMKTINRTSQYGGYMTEITFVNNNGQIAHTYVDTDNRNAKKWEEVIDLTERGWGVILDDLRYKVKDGEIQTKSKTKEPLINADSQVRAVLIQKDKQEILDQLAEVLAE